MPQTKLAIDPPAQTSDLSQLPQQAPPVDASATAEGTGYISPVAPAFSPITPKSQPVFPAYHPPADNPTLPPRNDSTVTAEAPPGSASRIAPAEYIPQPPPQPFSSEDSTDAIALRAAISTLQFQKKKAQEDIKALEIIRKKALNDPDLFKSELAAGRLKEQQQTAGDLRAMLDDMDTDEEGDGDDEAMQVDSNAAPFETIPGPQNVARMPNINWEKYHINGEALDRLHEQQRRWPGSFNYGQRTGREFAVAAPYSPWQDTLDTPYDGRKDSHATHGAAITPVTSEHPMETRRGGRH